MKIIFNEIKKIFNWKICVVLLIGTFLIYNLVMSFDIEVFPNGNPDTNIYNITVKMIEDYGQEMDEEEFLDFQKIYEEKLLEADKFLSNNKDFNKFGIYSYEDYLNKRGGKFDEPNEDLETVVWDNLLSSSGDIFWELQVMPGYIERYKNKDMVGQLSKEMDSTFERNKNSEERLVEISENEENKSIFPRMVLENYIRLIKGFTVSIIIGIAFVLTPIFLKDKRDKVDQIQYSSKIGRGLFKKKLVAGFISAMIITTVELGICMILYSTNNTSMFFKSNINSVYNNEYWFSMTFIQYIILTVVCVYILSIITAFISMFISSKVRSYVAALGAQVPTIFALCGLTLSLLMDNLTIIYKSKYLWILAYLFLIIIAGTLIIYAVKKERLKDILI